MGIMTSISLNLSIPNCRTREPFDSRTKQVDYVGNVIWENTLRQRVLKRSVHVISLNKFKIKQWSTFRKKLMRAYSSLAQPWEGFVLVCVSEGRRWYARSVHVFMYLYIHTYVGACICKYPHVWMCNFLSKMTKVKRAWVHVPFRQCRNTCPGLFRWKIIRHQVSRH